MHGGNSQHNSSKAIHETMSVGGEDEDHKALKINQVNPQARDGHACIIYQDKMVIFGGDRHHMPFNDLFLIDLQDFFFSSDFNAAVTVIE